VAIMTPSRSGQPPAVAGGEGGGGGAGGGVGGPWAVLFLVVTFGVIAAFVYQSNGNPEIRRVDLVAQEYADAWVQGNLGNIDYDALSGPGVGKGDATQISDAVRHIVHDLDGTGNLTPIKVTVNRDATVRESDPSLAHTQLWVTWELQQAGLSQTGHVWTYPVTLQERLNGGRWRVVWTPQTVHPALRQGLVFRVTRSLAPRAPLIGAGDTLLPPDGKPNLAHAVLGSIATKATQEQAAQNPLRSQPNDTVGIAGLQTLFDDRLGGGAQITVTAQLDQGVSGIVPTQNPLFVGTPQTPTPIQLTLDARTQQWAEAALQAATGPATLVVARPSTGDVLAVADTSATVDYGLSAQQPPGSIFGLTAYLAMLRQGFTATSAVDCRDPYTFPGSGQMFRNSQGPRIDQVRLGAAIEGGCTTALARRSNTVTPVELQTAAWDLGIATPLTTSDSQTPAWVTVSDQLGTPAYLGRVASDSGTDIGSPDNDPEGTKAVSPVQQAENMVGEGQVLVSPLSVTRATVTVATGHRKSLRLITNPAPQQADAVKTLPSDVTQLLQDVMSKAVTEAGGSAHALAGLPGSPVYAMAATAGYGTGRTDVRAAWVTGYRGDYAFTVLIPNAATTDGTRNAIEVARRFLLNIP
jgi:Penicillin binding protein transpeptidase domain